MIILKKFIMQKIFFIILATIAAILYGVDFANATLTIPWSEEIQKVSITSSTLWTADSVNLDKARDFWGNILGIARIVISGFALIYIVLIGAMMILHSEDDAQLAKQKKQILYAMVGFIFLNIPDIVYKLFMKKENGRELGGESWTNVNSNSIFWNNEFLTGDGSFFSQLIGFLKVVAFIAAVGSFVWGAYQLLLSRGKDDYKDNARNRLLYGVLGLIFLGIVEAWSFAVRQTNLQVELGKVAGSLFGLAIYFAAPVAIFFLILWSYYYITSGGDEERAKKGKNIFLYTFIAVIILIAGASFLNEILGLFNKQ